MILVENMCLQSVIHEYFCQIQHQHIVLRLYYKTEMSDKNISHFIPEVLEEVPDSCNFLQVLQNYLLLATLPSHALNIFADVSKGVLQRDDPHWHEQEQLVRVMCVRQRSNFFLLVMLLKR